GVPLHGAVAVDVALAGKAEAGVEEVAEPLALPPAGLVEVLGALDDADPVGPAVPARAAPGDAALVADRHPQEVDGVTPVGELDDATGRLESDDRHVRSGALARGRAGRGRGRCGRSGCGGLLDPLAEVGLHVGVVERLRVGEAHVGAVAHDLEAAL